jgi:hypothetical protein
MRRAISFTSGRGLLNTSSPKFTVRWSGSPCPAGRPGQGERPAALVGGHPTAPPVEVWMSTSQRRRMARMAARKSSASWEASRRRSDVQVHHRHAGLAASRRVLGDLLGG